MAKRFRLSNLARRLPGEVWSTFEPLLPPVVWKGNGRPPAGNQICLHGVLHVLVSGVGWDLVPPCFPCGKTLKGRLRQWLALGCFRAAWAALAGDYDRLWGINWDQVLLDGATHKSPRGAATGPSPVDRGKYGTGLHLATDGSAMPLGAVETAAGANDGVQAGDLLAAMVIRPLPPDVPYAEPERRDLPTARADGAYANAPTDDRAAVRGFRVRAPRRGRPRVKGVGRVRYAVERGHAFMSHFGRVVRRYDCGDRLYLGWVELAACVIFVRAGFFR